MTTPVHTCPDIPTLFGLTPVTTLDLEAAIAVIQHVEEIKPQLEAARAAYSGMLENGIHPDVARLLVLAVAVASGIDLPGSKDELLVAASDVLRIASVFAPDEWPQHSREETV